MMTRQPCLIMATSLFLFSLAGCASLKATGAGGLLKAGSDTPPVRCLCLWQPVETEDISGQAVRGFGGQIYFFAANSEEPVAVDGDVSVFVFDDVGTPSEQARPKDIQKYDSLTWGSFKNESQIGTNYSLFVPYKSSGQYETVCSLRVRLDRPDGGQLLSDMASVKLAGEPREDRSIRQLVSPREHSIRPDRSSELQVNLDSRSISNDRSTTIGSIREGSVSPADDDTVDGRNRSQVQAYRAKLAAMHARFEQNTGPQHRSSGNRNPDISDLLPAIRQVSGRVQQQQRRVTPAAHEIFASEEVTPVESTRERVRRSVPQPAEELQTTETQRYGEISPRRLSGSESAGFKAGSDSEHDLGPGEFQLKRGAWHDHSDQPLQPSARSIFGAANEDQFQPMTLERIPN